MATKSHNTALAQRVYAIEKYIEDAIVTGNNSKKLELTNECILKVLNNSEKYNYFKFLGTGKKSKRNI